MIINTCETFVCAILFIVGGIYWTGASKGNAAAGTGLLVICCFWTFSYQVIAMSYYLFSAELPSALLRGKFNFHVINCFSCTFSCCQLTLHSQDYTYHFLHQLDPRHSHLVSSSEPIPIPQTDKPG